MRVRFIAAMLILASSIALPASAQKSDSPANPRLKARASDAVVIPCGTVQTLYLSPVAWQANQRRVNLDFDATGGGTVWLVVPPTEAFTQTLEQRTPRHYTATTTIRLDGQNPVPVQVLAHAEDEPCVNGMTVTNLSVTVVP